MSARGLSFRFLPLVALAALAFGAIFVYIGVVAAIGGAPGYGVAIAAFGALGMGLAIAIWRAGRRAARS